MQELTNSIIKTVSSLAMKKFRDREHLFVAEGRKCVRDTWGNFPCRWLIATRAWIEACATPAMRPFLVQADERQMQRLSQFATPSDVMAVYRIPHNDFNAREVGQGLNIVLDGVQDPGNLGTIIRLADWFGLTRVFAGPGTADPFSHKVVQATMGAISRVRVHQVDLPSLFRQFPDLPVCGTFLNGENIYRASLPAAGFVVFGNEGQGISQPVAQFVTRRLLIPAWPHEGAVSDSLNVGLAAAITISEFRRNDLKRNG